MRHTNKNFSGFLSLVLLFLLFLAGCGGGGGDGDSTNPLVTTSSIQSLEAHTDSNGIASFTLSTGQPVSIQVIDLQTGNFISGIKVVLVSDGIDGFYMLSDDKDDNYVPKIINSSSSDLNKHITEAKAASVESSISATLTSWKEVIYRDRGIPISQNQVPAHLWKFFIENRAEYFATVKLQDLFTIWDLIRAVGNLGIDYVKFRLYVAEKEIIDAFKLSFQILGDSSVVSIELRLDELEWSLRGKGYNPDGDVDVYIIRPNNLSIIGEIIVIPREELPNPNNNASIFGRVTDTNGNPVPDTTKLNLFPHVESAHTKDGSYMFLNNIPIYGQSTEYIISVESLQYHLPEPKTITILPEQVWEVNFTLKPYDPLEPVGKIINWVRDAANGDILNGVFIRSYDTNTQRLSDSQTTSSPDGSIELNVNEGIHDLVFSKEGYGTQIDNVTVQANQTVAKETFLQKLVANQNPVISAVSITPSLVVVGGSSTATCNVLDPDGDALTYSWTHTGGTISGPDTSPIATWIAPAIAGNYTVTCTVSDGKGGTASKGITISILSSTTGTINVLSALDGSAWSGTVNYTISGPVNLNGTSVPVTFSAPAGTYTLTYLSGGPSGSTFTGINNSSTQTLSAGGSITFVVNFTIQTTPVLSVVPNTPVDFGSVTIGQVSSRVYAVWNMGSGTLTGTVSTSAPFSVGTGGEIQPGSTFNIPAGQSKSLVVQFNPSAVGSFGANVSFASNGGNTIRQVTGSGISSVITGTIDVKARLDGALTEWTGPLNFIANGPSIFSGNSMPATAIGMPAGTYTITYISGGPAGAIFTSITPSVTQTLTEGGSILFVINFTTSANPHLSVFPEGPVDFGIVPVGELRSTIYLVSNTGTGTLEGTVTVSNAPFSIGPGGEINTNSFSIPAGVSKSLVIRFSPTSIGSFNANVNFTSNGGNASRLVTGRGE